MKKENEIYCNLCGRKIKQQKDNPVEDFLSVKKEWGYFSDRDGLIQEFDLCEACYGELIRRFVLPVGETEQKEML